MTSGVHVSEFLLEVECGIEDDDGTTCDFTGEVLAWEDAEIHLWGWECPDCGYEHDFPTEYDEDYDAFDDLEWDADE